MERFCKYCGAKKEEGVICNCEESLREATEFLKANNSSDKEEVKRENGRVRRFFDLIKEYFTDTKGVTKKAIENKDKDFISGTVIIFILAVLLNFVVVFNKMKLNINDTIKKFIRYGEFNYSEFNSLKVEFSLGKVILNGVLLALAIGAILLGVTLILSKFNKKELTKNEIIYTTIINTLPMSLILIVGAILKLVLSYKYIFILQFIYLMMFIITIFISYNQVTKDLNTFKDIALFIVILCLGTYINLISYFNLVPNTFMAFKIGGRSIEPIVEEFEAKLEYMEEEFEKVNFEEAILELIEDFSDYYYDYNW